MEPPVTVNGITYRSMDHYLHETGQSTWTPEQEQPAQQRASVAFNHALRVDDTVRLVEKLNALIAMNFIVKTHVIGDEWVAVHSFNYTPGDDFFGATSTIPGYGPFGYGIHHQHEFRILTFDCIYSDECLACKDPEQYRIKEPTMEQVIEQGNYYRVVERNGKYYPEFWSVVHNQYEPYMEDGSIVELNSPEEVKAFWQKKEF